MSQQCAQETKKADSILVCIRNSSISSSSLVIMPLDAALVRPQLKDFVQFWAHHYREDVELPEHVMTKFPKPTSGSRVVVLESKILSM